MQGNKSLISVIHSLSTDVKILLSFNALAWLLVVYKTVFMPIYLSLIGFSPLMVGVYLTISTFAGGLADVTLAFLSDRFGRKKLLTVNIATSTLYYLIPFLTKDTYLILASAAFDFQGNRSSIVNALLADSVTDQKRTDVFTIKLFTGSLFGIIGSITAGTPPVFQSLFSFSEVQSFYPLFIIGIFLTTVNLSLMSRMKEPRSYSRKRKVTIPKEQYKIIAKLAVTHTTDNTAAAITLSIFSLWFTLRYSVGIGIVSAVFTFAQFIETFAYLAAPLLANRVGVVKGAVSIRILGAAMMFLIAFAPNPLIAALLYAFRNAFQRISHPLRESYMMAMLDSELRASGAAIINLPRLITSTIGPSIGGYLLGVSTLYPPITSGLIWLLGNGLYWIFFKDMRPPEEQP